MVFHNILVCTGPWAGCSMTLLGLVILFLVIAIVRKWVFEAMDYPFSFIIGEAIGIIAYIITYGITGAYKIALVAGLILGIGAGYLGSSFFDDSSGGGGQ